ncbi:hypothetical protein Bbelb_388580 [Branchiostoma belcheri]|nr:hypothetical protein Bbelb_388580 [Branchiostoma belcheri]
MPVQGGIPGHCDEATAHVIMDRFAELGGNFIDTADIYQYGVSEEYVGSWLSMKEREKFVIATKVCAPMDPTYKDPNQLGLSRHHIMDSIDKSLKRLQTDYVDLYQIHRWDDATPIEETMRALNDLVLAGKVRYIGASNVTGWQLQKIVELGRTMGLNKWITLQDMRPDVVPLGKALYPTFLTPPRGWLTGKFTCDMTAAPADTRVGWASEKEGRKSQAAPDFQQYAHNEKFWALDKVLKRVAKEQEFEHVSEVFVLFNKSKSWHIFHHVIRGAHPGKRSCPRSLPDCAMPLRYQCARFGVKCDFNYSQKKVISQTSILHPNHEIDRTRNQSLETLRAHNPIVINKVCLLRQCAVTPLTKRHRDLVVKTPRGTPPVAGSPPRHICYVTGQMNRIEPMPARLLSPTGTGRGYIPDGHRRAGKSVAQVSLRWLLQKDVVSSVIIGAKTLQQLEDNMGAAAGWELTQQQQMADLDAASAVEIPYPYEQVWRANKAQGRERP